MSRCPEQQQLRNTVRPSVTRGAGTGARPRKRVSCVAPGKPGPLGLPCSRREAPGGDAPVHGLSADPAGRTTPRFSGLRTFPASDRPRAPCGRAPGRTEAATCLADSSPGRNRTWAGRPGGLRACASRTCVPRGAFAQKRAQNKGVRRGRGQGPCPSQLGRDRSGGYVGVCGDFTDRLTRCRVTRDRKQRHCPMSHGAQGQPGLTGLNAG